MIKMQEYNLVMISIAIALTFFWRGHGLFRLQRDGSKADDLFADL